MVEALGTGSEVHGFESRWAYDWKLCQLSRNQCMWKTVKMKGFAPSFICCVKDTVRWVRAATRPRGYKTFFMLNSAEHELLNAHKYEFIKKFGIFQAQICLECYFSCSQMLIGILTFMNRKNFIRSWAENGKKYNLEARVRETFTVSAIHANLRFVWWLFEKQWIE